MAGIERFYQQGPSIPSFVRGACIACGYVIILTSPATYEQNEDNKCLGCGAVATRRRLIRQALANLDLVTWSLLASDLYTQDQFPLDPTDHIICNFGALRDVKWHHEEVFPNAYSAERYVTNLLHLGDFSYLTLQDTQSHGPDQSSTETSTTPIPVFWWRFGLLDREAVPAWRQSLQGAATLVYTNPAAALVLIAAGFEAFYTETMRIAWIEKGLEPGGFERLNKRNLAISNVIGWLAAAVGKPSLPDNDALFENWQKLVNGRRNQVVHRAVVNFTPEEARESLGSALECIEFIDSCGLVRPHAYYRRPDVHGAASPGRATE